MLFGIPALRESAPVVLGQAPAAAGHRRSAKLAAIEALVLEDIAQKRLPGAVVLVGHRQPHRLSEGDRPSRAGSRARADDARHHLRPGVADQAVATTTSVMLLVEQGRIRLIDRVSTFMPGFERYGKADITVRHLLTHMSGLRPDVDLGTTGSVPTRPSSWRSKKSRPSPPGTRFVYSDINFFLLGEIVKRVSGESLDQFTQKRDLHAARDERHDVQSARSRCSRASRRPRAAPGSDGRARART